jgi:chaperone required for assembly of F1-ATPase
MKRFYRQVAVASSKGGWEILLDGRPVRTPARHPLLLPGAPLAEAVAEEWRAQGEKIDPRAMRMTGLANAAIDRVEPDPEAFAASLACYGESDLLCYRAEGPESLVQLQCEQWDPLIAWARRRFDLDLEIVCGVIHKAQPEDTVRQLAHAAASRTPFELAGLAPLVTLSGSLLIALALTEEAIERYDAWAAATLDERWQVEQWGEDAEAVATLALRRVEFDAADDFLNLLRDS